MLKDKVIDWICETADAVGLIVLLAVIFVGIVLFAPQ
jgi:hypothetical protein